MTSNEAQRIVSIIGSAWTHKQWGTDQISLWANAIATLDYEPAHRAVEEMVSNEKWPPTVATLNEYMRVALGEVRAELPATHGCDGSAWIEASVGMVPCPICNPMLADIFQSSDKIRQWKNGAKVTTLTTLTDVPASCVPSTREDPNDPVRRRPVKAIRL